MSHFVRTDNDIDIDMYKEGKHFATSSFGWQFCLSFWSWKHSFYLSTHSINMYSFYKYAIYVPGTALRTLKILIHLILITTLLFGSYNYHHIRDEELEAEG